MSKNEKDKAIKVFSEKYAIETKGKSNVLSYPGTLYVRVEVKIKKIYFGKSTFKEINQPKKIMKP